MSEPRVACRLDEIEDGRAKAVAIDGLSIAIFRRGADVHALLNRCPHANGSMAGGWVEGDEAVCPVHQWRFRLGSGRCTTVRGQSLHRFACEVRDGLVWVTA